MDRRSFSSSQQQQSQPVRAGTAFYELRAKDAGFSGTVNRASSQLRSFAAAVTATGTKISALGALIVAPMTAAAKVFKDVAIETSNLAKKMDVSVESMSALAYAAERAGTSLKALGSDKDAWQKFFDTSGGETEIRKLMERARELGLVMSKEDAAAAEEYRVALADLNAVLRGITTTIGAAVAPILTDMAKRTQAVAQQVGTWVRENRALVAEAFRVAKGVALAGAAITVVGVALGGVAGVLGVAAGGFTLLVAAATALISPVGIAVALLATLGARFLYMRGVGGSALSFLTDAFKSLKARAEQSFAGISDAMAGGDLQLAAQLLWASLKIEWIKGTEALARIWEGAQELFVDAVNTAIGKAGEAWDGAKGVFAEIGAAISGAWKSAMNSMADAANGAIESIGRAFNDLLFKVLPVLNEIEGRFRRTWGSIVKIGSIFGLVKDPEAKGRSVNVTKTPEQLIGGLILKGFDKGMENFMRPDPVPYKPAPFVGGTRTTPRRIQRREEAAAAPAQAADPGGMLRDLWSKVGEAMGSVANFAAMKLQPGPDRLGNAVAERDRLAAAAAESRKDAAKGKLSDLELPNLAKNLATQVVGTFNGLNASQALGTGGGVLYRIANGVERWAIDGANMARDMNKVANAPARVMDP